METSKQFVMISSSPERQTFFDEQKAVYGSVFAFHGSGIENWHAIIRTGLVNASGTALQVNGAACGSGIYVSLSVSSSPPSLSPPLPSPFPPSPLSSPLSLVT